jgi:hypothetical protein
MIVSEGSVVGVYFCPGWDTDTGLRILRLLLLISVIF